MMMSDEQLLYKFKPHIFVMIGMNQAVSADGQYALLELDLDNNVARLEETETGVEIKLRVSTFQEAMVCINP